VCSIGGGLYVEMKFLIYRYTRNSSEKSANAGGGGGGGGGGGAAASQFLKGAS